MEDEGMFRRLGYSMIDQVMFGKCSRWENSNILADFGMPRLHNVRLLGLES